MQELLEHGDTEFVSRLHIDFLLDNPDRPGIEHLLQREEPRHQLQLLLLPQIIQFRLLIIRLIGILHSIDIYKYRFLHHGNPLLLLLRRRPQILQTILPQVFLHFGLLLGLPQKLQLITIEVLRRVETGDVLDVFVVVVGELGAHLLGLGVGFLEGGF